MTWWASAAGVKGTWNSAEEKLPFTTHGVNWGEPPTEDRWPDGKTSKELFVNLRAELAWKLRRRFERAFEFVEQGVLHAPEDMISIPNHTELIADLSTELYHRTETGKIQLESKKDSQRRGVKSPDYKDALAFYFAPRKGGWWRDERVVAALVGDPAAQAHSAVRTDAGGWWRKEGA